MNRLGKMDTHTYVDIYQDKHIYIYIYIYKVVAYSYIYVSICVPVSICKYCKYEEKFLNEQKEYFSFYNYFHIVAFLGHSQERKNMESYQTIEIPGKMPRKMN